MSWCLNLPLFLIVLSLISAVLCTVLKRKAAYTVSMILPLLSFAGNLIILIYTIRTGQNYTYLMGHFPHPWGNELKIGVLESLFSCAFSLILFMTLMGGKKQLFDRIDPAKQPLYSTMTNLIQSALLVLAYTNDIFTGYVFIEICTIASIGILMIKENGRTILASTRYMIFSLVGSGLFLFGIIFLYSITGHLLMPDLKNSVALLYDSGQYRLPLFCAMSLIVIGLAVKSGLFPFHLWMPDTYGAAIPTSSGILSGLISKGYIFLLLKIIFDVFGKRVFFAAGMNNVLYILGVSGVILGSVSALRENDIFRMTAYSSSAQIGYIYMGLGLSPVLGVEASLFHILVHAFTKPAVFLAEGYLSFDMGSAKKFKNLQGSGYVNPAAGAAFSFGAFCMIGLPLTMGFISKYLFGAAAFESTHNKMIPTLIALAVSTILNTMYFARTIIRIYTKREDNPLPPEPVDWKERARRPYIAVSVIFVLMNVSLGILSKPFIDLLAYGISLF